MTKGQTQKIKDSSLQNQADGQPTYDVHQNPWFLTPPPLSF